MKRLKEKKKNMEARLEGAEGALAAAQAEVQVTREAAAKAAESQSTAAAQREGQLAQQHSATVSIITPLIFQIASPLPTGGVDRSFSIFYFVLFLLLLIVLFLFFFCPSSFLPENSSPSTLF